MSLRLLLITNSPDMAEYANECGVDRIFVDLEYLGKEQRQANLKSVKNFHTPNDIRAIREKSDDITILARINPFYEGSRREIDDCIQAGANIIMLPMFKNHEEINRVADWIAGRSLFCPLIETWDAVSIAEQVLGHAEVDEVYFGLNDLAIARQKKFMFQSLVDGSLEQAFQFARASGKPFGVGGIARLGQGTLSADLILKEHVRIGSTAVILSQSFHNSAKTLQELKSNLDLKLEVSKLKNAYSAACDLRQPALQENSVLLSNAVSSLVAKL